MTARRPGRIVVASALVLALSGAGFAFGGVRGETAARVSNPKALPLGDGRISSLPKVGYVAACLPVVGGMGGAQAAGPWIDEESETWDRTAKLSVSGAVNWPAARYTVKVVGSKRVIAFNNLPINHTTGVYPVAAADPAAAYDRNPNRIAAQSVNWRLPLNPKAAGAPFCSPGGPIGVLSDGAFLYNALDAQGRDAPAREVLDRCGGHPDPSGSYHHHDIPSCILARAARGAASLVGYALDGYGIYVVKDAAGKLPTNAALDACHGRTGVVPWNGTPTRIYHYVATLEYPYTVGCFRGDPISSGHGPGGGS